MQLRATLDSFELHARGQVNRTTVLYRATTAAYQEGYDLLIAMRPNVEFVRETAFDEDLKKLLSDEWTLFAADDDLVFGDFNRHLLDAIDERTACFSLRLGLNIGYCYSNDKPNKLKAFTEDGEFIRWAWRGESLDFGYPLSVVSHVFRTSEIRQFTVHGEFRNPNEYEGMLQKYLAYVRPQMASYRSSRIVGVPANRVNDSCLNRNGLTHAYGTEELLARYLAGEIIDIVAMDYSVTAAQQELQYAFRKA